MAFGLDRCVFAAGWNRGQRTLDRGAVNFGIKLRSESMTRTISQKLGEEAQSNVYDKSPLDLEHRLFRAVVGQAPYAAGQHPVVPSRG